MALNINIENKQFIIKVFHIACYSFLRINETHNCIHFRKRFIGN